MAHEELSTEHFQRIAKAISDPNRWEMLQTIFKEPEVTCGTVSGGLSITAGTASHHLRELEAAELIQVAKCGRYRKLTANRSVWQAYVARLQTL